MRIENRGSQGSRRSVLPHRPKTTPNKPWFLKYYHFRSPMADRGKTMASLASAISTIKTMAGRTCRRRTAFGFRPLSRSHMRTKSRVWTAHRLRLLEVVKKAPAHCALLILVTLARRGVEWKTAVSHFSDRRLRKLRTAVRWCGEFVLTRPRCSEC